MNDQPSKARQAGRLHIYLEHSTKTVSEGSRPAMSRPGVKRSAAPGTMVKKGAKPCKGGTISAISVKMLEVDQRGIMNTKQVGRFT